MAEIWKGKPVADALVRQMTEDVAALSARRIVPTLGLLRVGEREDDLVYEKGIIKRCEAVGVHTQRTMLPAHSTQQEFDEAFRDMNDNPQVHGILVFRPLPGALDDALAADTMRAEKDVDGSCARSHAGVYMGDGVGFAPCTAEAVMELLHHYGVNPEGKRAVVIGRSLVIGKPVAMMLMKENATVTVCHTKTKDIEAVAAQADILIAAAGRAGYVTEKFTNPGQIVIDVGINPDPATGGITGDVDFDSVSACVKAVTPVPGGVGSVTTAVLVKHVVEAAKRSV